MKISILAALELAAAAVASEHSFGSTDMENKMEHLMSLKISHNEMKRAAGVFAEGKYKAMGATPCKGGKAGEYSCGNVDLEGFLPHGDMGSETRQGNDIWGK